uniref:Uncharacterized protein n=1 Tax=uncultured Planctomycetota bacterium TaxID=120965 RepID=H5SE85_9BACT|nr:hypothetical protein HGMM_F16E03C10 [uncultured Planctomycetota bacterium]
MHEIEFSPKEFRDLVQFLKDDALLCTLLSRLQVRNGQIVISVTKGEARQLQLYFSDQVCQVGFDEHYELTKEGKVLDELVYKFLILD